MLTGFLYFLSYINCFFVAYLLLQNEELIICVSLCVLFFYLYKALKSIILYNYFNEIDNLYSYYYYLLFLNKWTNKLIKNYIEFLNSYYYNFDLNYFLSLIKILIFDIIIKEQLTKNLLKINKIFFYFLNIKVFFDNYMYNLLIKNIFNNKKYIYFLLLNKYLVKNQKNIK
jgi:hypothetical protein